MIRRGVRPKPEADLVRKAGFAVRPERAAPSSLRWVHAAVCAAGALILVMALYYLWEDSRGDAYRPPTAEAPVRPKRVYNEKLEGSSYKNQDLGLSIEGPSDWKAALGARLEETPPYEGLLVKMEIDAPPDEATKLRPLVSVVKQTLVGGAARDALGFLRTQIVSSKKEITQPPQVVELGGQPMAKVAYRMASGEGTIQVVQYVHIAGEQAIVLSAMAPSGQFAALEGTFERVFGSLALQ